MELVELFTKEVWVFDLENAPNFTGMVARKLGSKEYKKFVIHESQDDSVELHTWLCTKPVLCGYNNLAYDNQIIEHIYRHGAGITAEEIWVFIETLPINTGADSYDVPYKEWDFSFSIVDLFKMNRYDQMMISLKWLEFTTRSNAIIDIPFTPGEPVPKTKITKIMSYCKHDVDTTHDFMYHCADMISLRIGSVKRLQERRVMNMSDSSIGSFIFEKILLRKGYDKNMLKRGTVHKSIPFEPLLLPIIKFQGDVFNGLLNVIKSTVFTAESTFSHNVLFEDMVFSYGLGGLHSCWKAGEFDSGWYDADWNCIYPDSKLPDTHSPEGLKDQGLRHCTIRSFDFTSFYPSLAIVNRFYPTHIGPEFCDIFEGVFNERKKYPKGSVENYSYKIALNSVYGKSNAYPSLFHDEAYMYKTTINGQLLLTMLTEAQSKYGRLLLVNTDGFEIIVPDENLETVNKINRRFEEISKLLIESDTYQKMVIRDVNNYIALSMSGKVKRKGVFETFDDIKGGDGRPHQFHKNTSSLIVSKALMEYYVNDVAIEDTIRKEENIHEFCIGIKADSRFQYWLLTSKDGVVDIDRRDEKVIRYFISVSGANVFKYWKDGRKNLLSGINRGQLVTLLMKMRNEKVLETYDINYQYYIDATYKIVDIIEANTRDKSYLTYFKKLKKHEEGIIDDGSDDATDDDSGTEDSDN